MVNFTIEIDTDSDDHVVDGRQVVDNDNLSTGLQNYERPKDLTEKYLPICNVKVEQLSSGGQGQKTHWLLAEIYEEHLGKGEATSKNSSLAEKIRSRGKSDDDCGHIIACSLGGKMVDFNLFPQNKNINRGFKGWKNHWRRGIEHLIYIWLKKRFCHEPHVQFQVRFFYTDSHYPNRPDHGKFLIHFKGGDSEANMKVNNLDKNQCSAEVYTRLKGVLQNVIENELEPVAEPNYERVISKALPEFDSISCEQFQHFILLLINDFKKDEQQPSTSTSSPYCPIPAPLKSK
ncbi:unnamed protein product [Adineta steineri]|uniref:Type VII secretion system protein EssD-like domain-containing protein n=1 Tax=Adineta steineri TaxID=433720 RepID=A0A814ATX1_9BILA|nr:unnamed protein product [Adineta steineri]CAF1491425.1 unnamed protein product [Adineta steineri]CAF1641588.1 unnamed protein product [Adineta steineri]CAF3996573.1 unnamed protein product [Adineta steineri]